MRFRKIENASFNHECVLKTYQKYSSFETNKSLSHLIMKKGAKLVNATKEYEQKIMMAVK